MLDESWREQQTATLNGIFVMNAIDSVYFLDLIENCISLREMDECVWRRLENLWILEEFFKNEVYMREMLQII